MAKKRKSKRYRSKIELQQEYTFAPKAGVREIDMKFGLVFRVHRSMVQVIHPTSNTLVFQTKHLDDTELQRFVTLASYTLRHASDAWRTARSQGQIEDWFNHRPDLHREMKTALATFR